MHRFNHPLRVLGTDRGEVEGKRDKVEEVVELVRSFNPLLCSVEIDTEWL